jgi:hypothetical protein
MNLFVKISLLSLCLAQEIFEETDAIKKLYEDDEQFEEEAAE